MFEWGTDLRPANSKTSSTSLFGPLPQAQPFEAPGSRKPWPTVPPPPLPAPRPARTAPPPPPFEFRRAAASAPPSRRHRPPRPLLPPAVPQAPAWSRGGAWAEAAPPGRGPASPTALGAPSGTGPERRRGKRPAAEQPAALRAEREGGRGTKRRPRSPRPGSALTACLHRGASPGTERRARAAAPRPAPSEGAPPGGGTEPAGGRRGFPQEDTPQPSAMPRRRSARVRDGGASPGRAELRPPAIGPALLREPRALFFLNTTALVIGGGGRREAVPSPPRELWLGVEDANSNWGSWRFEHLADTAAAAHACGARTPSLPLRLAALPWQRAPVARPFPQGRGRVPAGSVTQGPSAEVGARSGGPGSPMGRDSLLRSRPQPAAAFPASAVPLSHSHPLWQRGLPGQRSYTRQLLRELLCLIST